MENKLEWNYKIPNEISVYNFDMQDDWNQTLMTKINYINALLYGANMYRNHIIIAPIKFKKLFETLIYYDFDKYELANRYHVIYRNDDNDYINVQGVPLKIENFML